jgi:hypothetical protein
MPNDEFERLLERCGERLAEISLTVPALESGAPRKEPARYSLTPPVEPVPPPKPLEAAPLPAAPARLEVSAPLPREPEPAPKPLPFAAEEPDEDAVFPPPRMQPRTPPPSTPLWRARPAPTPPPPAVPVGGRRSAAAVAAAAVVAAGSFGAWLIRRPVAELDLDVGGAEAMTVRLDKGDVLIAEGKELVDLTRDGKTLGRRSLAAPVDSLCWAQGSLWTADGRTASIVEHAEDGRETVFSLNHVPGALYVRDKYLWTADKDGRVIHQFLVSRSILGALLQPLDSFELNGLSPESFTIDDAGTLWLADRYSRRLYRLRLENGSYRSVSSAPLSPFVGPEGRLRDLTVEGGAVWLLGETSGGRTSLRRLRLSRLDWTPS